MTDHEERRIWTEDEKLVHLQGTKAVKCGVKLQLWFSYSELHVALSIVNLWLSKFHYSTLSWWFSFRTCSHAVWGHPSRSVSDPSGVCGHNCSNNLDADQLITAPCCPFYYPQSGHFPSSAASSLNRLRQSKRPRSDCVNI